MARTESDDRSDETLTIDLEAVREKYRQERDKRSVGRTYQFARGDFSRYARDPTPSGRSASRSLTRWTSPSSAPASAAC